MTFKVYILMAAIKKESLLIRNGFTFLKLVTINVSINVCIHKFNNFNLLQQVTVNKNQQTFTTHS
jgi:hypothetical protein